jgi:PDDEXK-like domain of unknown function (DUF3799)
VTTPTVNLTATGDAVVRDLPHDEYLRHPALSASGAKLLVQPGGPARYLYRLANPEPPRDVFDVGHAAHAAVLGVGPDLIVLDFPDWRSKAARDARDDARAAGQVPILPDTARQVADMAAALRADPLASKVITPGGGEPEVSLFWHDDEHDVDRRGRVDWLRKADGNGRLILVDYKTASSAAPDAFARAVVNFGYHQQAAWYRDLVVGLGLASSAPFLFVVQETTPPYLCNVIELDEATLLMGADLNARALRTFAECTTSGHWPGYTAAGIATVSAPRWAHVQHEAAEYGDA